MPQRRKKPAPINPVANLETKGDRLQVYTLHKLLTNKKNPHTRDAARLGDVLLPWFEKTVAKPAEKLEGIADLWQELLPAAIVAKSRLAGFYRGTLTVIMDSAPVRAQLDSALRGGMLRKLQTASRGTLFRVKTIVESPHAH